MSRRTTTDAGESLELLLDTICNTFGGVLFIAILLAISVRPEPTSPEPSVRPEELLTQSRAEDLQAQIESLQKAIAGIGQQAAALMPDDAGEQSLAVADQSRREAESVVASATERRDSSKRSADEAMANADAAANENENDNAEAVRIDATIAKERERNKTLKTALVAARKALQPTISVPSVTRAGRKTEAALVMQFGRLYEWHNHSALVRRVNERDMTIEPRANAGRENQLISRVNGEAVSVKPRPNAGIDLSAGDAASDVAALLTRYPSRRYTVALVVRSDSFAGYEIVRDAVKGQGSRFRVFAGPQLVSDFGGSGGPVQ